ncbi:MAG: YceI family protein [Bacteroidia bacterium]|nr:YceI family protein [Bacteroidia bacterium]
MKSILIALMFIASQFAIATNPIHEEDKKSHAVDTKSSTLEWKGSKVTGDNHVGDLQLKQGTIVTDDGNIMSVEIEIDMTTINDKDLTDPEWNAKLVGHLKSDDFFSVDKYPTASFKSTGTSVKDGKTHVTGNLTIKGQSHPVTILATFKNEDGILTVSGKFKFDRSKYDVRYGSGSFFEDLGDKLIYDDIEMKFVIKTSK